MNSFPKMQLLKQWLAGSVLIAWCCGAEIACGAPLVIDAFSYTNNTLARAAWVGVNGPQVAMTNGTQWATGQVMIATCDFATRSTRCFWDRTVSLRLGSYTDFALDVFSPTVGVISSFTLYFRSGGGYYGATVAISQPGWQRLRFSKAQFISEGTPAGWDNVDGIRLSAWKGAAVNTFLAFDELKTYTPPVLLVRDPQSSNPAIVQETIDRHVEWLGRYQVECGVVTRADVEAGLLAESRLAVLPYNENVSELEMTRLESFVSKGGKLMVYYLLPSRLADLLGVQVIKWTTGGYGAWRFTDTSIPGLPSRVEQASWNITVAKPGANWGARVLATWEDRNSADTGQPAWLASDHGFFMSHVLLQDDANRKSYALLCLVGNVVPDVWPRAAEGALGKIGNVGPYLDYSTATGAILKSATQTLRANLVEQQLGLAQSNRTRATAALAAGNYAYSISASQAAREDLRRAYLLSLRPEWPEFRGIWEHHATGPYPGNWGAGLEALRTNGFNAILPNMLWGGVAHYNSAVLPHSSEYLMYGDQIAACLEAAHSRGIEVHVWKVNWNLLGAPPSFINSLRAANRTQVSRQGTNTDWLCPSHPENFALETNSLLEVVRNYDIDGIHFDYIRYPDADHCYCTGCRERFKAQTGASVTTWPGDVLAPGALRTTFLNWRRAQITKLVSVVHASAKALKPGVKISAAVFPEAPSAYDEVGQDWRLWVTNQVLDFVCPMDYSTDFYRFTNLVAQQLGYAGGRIPVYPGIGAWLLESDQTAAQVQATRSAKTGGFIVFELSPNSAASLLPDLRAGVVAPDEPDVDNDNLADAWEKRWFTNLAQDAGDDVDGDGLSNSGEYILGSDPTQQNPGPELFVRSNGTVVTIEFAARAVDAPGYNNAERHYRLETLADFAGGTWEAVSGYSDITPAGTPLIRYTPASSGPGKWYRLKVWLEQKR